MKFFGTILILSAFSVSFGAGLQNGSFENGPSGNYLEVGTGGTDVTNWVGTYSGFEWFVPSTYAAGLGNADSGISCVDLANYVYADGGISQTFNTVAGQMYTVSFAGSTSTYAGRDGTGLLDVSVAGYSNTFALSNVQVGLVWTNYSFSFLAAGSSSTLEFSNHQDPYTHFALLDSVNVAAVPGPGAALVFGLGLVRGRRKRV